MNKTTFKTKFMKRNILLLFVAIFATIASYGQSVYVTVITPDDSDPIFRYFKEAFIEALMENGCRVHMDTSLENQSFGGNMDLSEDSIAHIGHSLTNTGVKLLCVAVVEKTSKGEFYFRSQLINTETGALVAMALYPDVLNFNKEPIKSLETSNLQNVIMVLVSRLFPNGKVAYELQRMEEFQQKKTKKRKMA